MDGDPTKMLHPENWKAIAKEMQRLSTLVINKTLQVIIIFFLICPIKKILRSYKIQRRTVKSANKTLMVKISKAVLLSLIFFLF